MAFLNPRNFVGTLVSYGYLAQGMTAVDFGCGCGFMSLALAERVSPGGLVVAVDVQPDALRALAHLAQLTGMHHIQLLHHDLEAQQDIPLAPESTHLAILSNLLPQTEDPIRILQETKRILAPSGTVVVVEWDPAWFPFESGAVLPYAPSETIGLLRHAGFSLLRTVHAGTAHYAIAASPAADPVELPF